MHIGQAKDQLAHHKIARTSRERPLTEFIQALGCLDDLALPAVDLSTQSLVKLENADHTAKKFARCLKQNKSANMQLFSCMHGDWEIFLEWERVHDSDRTDSSFLWPNVSWSIEQIVMLFRVRKGVCACVRACVCVCVCVRVYARARACLSAKDKER